MLYNTQLTNNLISFQVLDLLQMAFQLYTYSLRLWQKQGSINSWIKHNLFYKDEGQNSEYL